MRGARELLLLLLPVERVEWSCSFCPSPSHSLCMKCRHSHRHCCVRAAIFLLFRIETRLRVDKTNSSHATTRRRRRRRRRRTTEMSRSRCVCSVSRQAKKRREEKRRQQEQKRPPHHELSSQLRLDGWAQSRGLCDAMRWHVRPSVRSSVLLSLSLSLSLGAVVEEE